MNISRLNRAWLQMFFALLPLSAFAQDIQWEKSYGGKHADYLFDAVPTADYGFILAGSSLSGETGNKATPNKGGLDYFVWKMDEKGEAVWQKSFGGKGIDLLKKVVCAQDGGYLLAGTSDSAAGLDKKEDAKGSRDFWLIKLNAGGGEQWQKTLGGVSDDELTFAAGTLDGGFVIGGYSSSDNSKDKKDKARGGTDYWIIRLDASGNVKWEKTLGGAGQEELRAIVTCADGNFLVAGVSRSSDSFDKTSKNFGGSDFWILMLDKDGAPIWQQTYGGAKDDQLQAAIETKDGGYVLAGHSNSDAGFNKTTSSKGGSDFWVIRVDAQGMSHWQENFDFNKYDVLNSIVENSDGTFLVGGTSKSEVFSGKDSEGTNDYIALKINGEGKEIWRRTFGSEGEDVLRELIATRDGGYLLAGTSNPEYKPKPKKSRGKNALGKVGSGQNLAVADKAQEQMDGYATRSREIVNDYYKEQTAALATEANDALNPKDSPVKVGVSAPGNLLGQGSGGGKGANGDHSGNTSGTTKKLPVSRQKSNNFGKNDFWVVKLKDKDKKEKARQNIEAIPNPTYSYTNVVVGYEYEKGTATVYDLSGRQLQAFPITDRTVPVNLEGLPEGIYIVNIRTEKSDDSVKILKATRK